MEIATKQELPWKMNYDLEEPKSQIKTENYLLPWYRAE